MISYTANGVFVDGLKIRTYAENIVSVMNAVPSIEFIVQCNDETKPVMGPDRKQMPGLFLSNGLPLYLFISLPPSDMDYSGPISPEKYEHTV